MVQRGEAMLPAALRHLVLFCFCGGLATPPLLDGPPEGSTDEEELLILSVPLPTRNVSLDNGTAVAAARPLGEQAGPPGGVVHLLKENLLLVLVAGSLVLLLALLVAVALLMSRRRKVNAYYPSSFPSGMYVDTRDQAGGGRPFNEVEGRAAPRPESEPLDSHQQLRADIVRAAMSLRTPNRPEAAQPPPEGGAAEPHLPSIPEGNLLWGLPDGAPETPETPETSKTPETSETSKTPETSETTETPQTPETSETQEEESREPLIGRGLRPSSLHVHNDSATLQLIAGEKTAF